MAIQNPSDEALFAQMQRGTMAASMQAFVKPMLEERRTALTTAAVNKYNAVGDAPKLTDRDAFIFVASLAETFKMEEDLQRIIETGQKAGQHFTR